MKLLILGKSNTYECSRILKESQLLGISAQFHAFSEIILFNDKKLSIYIDNSNILEYDVVIFRGIGKNLNIAMMIAEYLHNSGKVVIDRKLSEEKYYTEKTYTMFLCDKFKLPYAKSVQIFSNDQIAFIKNNFKFPLIIKEIASSQGKGVYLINDQTKLNEFLKNQKVLSNLLIQEKIRKKAEDYRVMIVGNKSLGVMKKIAKKNEYRSNVSQGGLTSMINNSKISNLAIKIAKLTKTEIAGVDIMFDEKDNPYILEVNRAPQFKGFEATSGTNVAKEIAKYILNQYQNNR